MSNARPGAVAPQQQHTLSLHLYKIKAATATGLQDGEGNNLQFKYTVAEVYNLGWSNGGRGYDSTWAEFDDGAWINSHDPVAYNMMEHGATATGRQPSGVNVDSTCFTEEGAEVLPLQTGAIHPGVVVPLHIVEHAETADDSIYTIWLMPYQAWDV